MTDVFDEIERKVQRIFGEEAVCVHVGNVDECDIKRHPLYVKFRADAVASGVKAGPSSRLWESLIAMGRLGDMNGDDTWQLVILDCIVPCFRGLSTRIARDFRVEREEIRAAMVATALEVWNSTATGVPPRHVRDRMVKAAFEVAFRRGSANLAEHSSEYVDQLVESEIADQGWDLKASTIIDVGAVRDASVAEQIRGERWGALLHGVGCFDFVIGFHEELRAGRRSGTVSQSVRGSELLRSRISDPNLYYYASDLYPQFIGLREAANVMGVTESAAYRLIRDGHFPLPAARTGRSYKVSVKALMHYKDIPNAIVHVDDVENGALHAGRGEPVR